MSRFLPDSWREVVADTSAVINLNATGRAAEILRIFPSLPAVTESVRAELKTAGDRGRHDLERLEALASGGSLRIVNVGAGAAIYQSLIEGSAQETLDDGEAATIAYAAAYGRSAFLDDRKARRICSERFPGTPIIYTLDLLLDRCVRDALGEQGQTDAMFRALQEARMRVPFERVRQVVGLIGEDRAALCPSLPRSFRRR